MPGITLRFLLMLITVFFGASVSNAAPAPVREVIGKVLGRPVFRDELIIPEEYRNVDPLLIKKLRAEETARPVTPEIEWITEENEPDDPGSSATPDLADPSEETIISDADEVSESSDLTGFSDAENLENLGTGEHEDLLDLDIGSESEESPGSAEEFEKAFDTDSSSENPDENIDTNDESDKTAYIEDPEELAWENEKIKQSELLRLFAGPLFAEYSRSLGASIEATPEEVDLFLKELGYDEDKEVRYLNDCLQRIDSKLEKLYSSPGEIRQKLIERKAGIQEQISRKTKEIENSKQKKNHQEMAKSMIKAWKLQIKLYENFGGGRILWQQAGFEAFDAMRQFLAEQQKLGRYEISDPDLQETLLHYWTEPGHRSFLKSDPETVEKFLNPAWKH